MIGYLRGKIVLNNGSNLIVDVNGVGYRVNFRSMHSVGAGIELYVYTAVKENDISLWGFQSKEELQLFEKLLSVSGVGGKTAQLIVQEHGVGKIIQAVMFKDADALKVSGVGKKTAEKIIIELDGRLSDISHDPGDAIITNTSHSQNVVEAIDGLISLGYQRTDIEKALANLKKENNDITDYTVQDIIKIALKYL